MKILQTILTAAFLILLPVIAFAEDCNEFANTMTKQVLTIFHDKASSEQQKRQALSSLFQKAVDTDWIGKFVLGRFWKSASADEQKQYLEKYRLYITQNYVSKFDDDAGFSVDDIKLAAITPAQNNQFEAKSLIIRKGEEDVHADYLLDGSSSKCQVHDIKIEGVSLLATQRSEFQSLAGSSGIKGIISAMDKQLITND